MGVDKKKIAVFTGARSEYGPLKPLLSAFQEDPYFDMELIVAAGHLSPSQGNTISEIEKDGFPIGIRIHNMLEENNASAISISNGQLQIELAEYLNQCNPDLVIVLGDRSELVAVVSTALFQSIPVAHLSGGEVTEGATDNQIRHAVTKMSHIHFPTTEIYGENIRKMGEEDWRICVAGEPGLDDVLHLVVPTEKEFRTHYGIPENTPFILSTFHSETINQTINKAFISELIDKLCSLTNYHLLFTAANTDVGGIEINETLLKTSQSNPRVSFVESLGKTNYYAAQHYASCMLGNSSSGLIEAQSFQIPVVNVGSRQQGRLRNPNSVDVAVDVNKVIGAVQFVSSEEFKDQYIGKPNLFGDGRASERILQFLKTIDWNNLLLKKSTF
ncbi:UDP-N-acetylglucosamine 2-epimerase [Fluviicola taffensis]|uniref:UDP-N-acetyl-D-glucosamine 2-epimerase, UDP-hydrolysing n=1 Tax=Fluviicola taffensis (strain DSM 16823 / NCIMB 13979 / RW262) TaxID=755732 RepID=F2IA11_FLUTR|nr:UDP-N-acetylglucosamine 2-epimerase [Fluviicola taffensis]AEA44169.1 UDP-N-acetyl-D-glucosamine 2-epimerase, UDP-hydrolysing [Fluviicola taffensis DSM 16823]